MDNLRPCPFCGGDDLKVHISCHRDFDGNPIYGQNYYFVSCRGECFFSGPSSEESQEDAIKKWNTRIQQ